MITLLEKWNLLHAAFADPALSPRAKLVLGALLACLNARSGRCHPSLDVLAERTGCHRRRVSPAIAELATGGWLTTKRRRGSAIYSLNFDRIGARDDVQESSHLNAADDVQESSHLPSPDDVQEPSHLPDDQGDDDVQESSRLHVLKSSHLIESEIPSLIQKKGKGTRESDSVSAQADCEQVEEGGERATAPPSRRRAKARGAPTEQSFAEFWRVFPRKVAKLDARQAFDEAIASGKIEAAELVAGAKRYAEAVAADGRPAKFVKQPGGWIRAERWTDAPEVGSVQPTKAVLPDDGDPWLAPVLVRLAAEIGPDDVTSWLGRLAVARRDGASVTLSAPSRFTAGEIETRFGDRLRAAIAAVHGIARVEISATRPAEATQLGGRVAAESPQRGASAAGQA